MTKQITQRDNYNTNNYSYLLPGDTYGLFYLFKILIIIVQTITGQWSRPISVSFKL